MFRLFVFIFLFGAQLYAKEFVPVLELNGSSQTLEMQAGQIAPLSLQFLDKETGRPFSHFMEMHGKLLHMLIVRDDLETFVHVHPTFSHSRKKFEIQLNGVSEDPDNFDLPKAVLTGGRHFIFTENMPHVEGEDMFMLQNRFAIVAKETNKKFDSKSRTPTLNEWPNEQVSYFDDSGMKAVYGARYRLTFSYDQFLWCTWYIPKFYLNVDVWNSSLAGYEPATNLQEWLKMGGHGVVISRGGDLDARHFYHLHAMLPLTVPGEFAFPYDDHSKPMADGDYRVWFQFNEDNKVRTIYFDFLYVNPPSPGKSEKRIQCLK